MFVYNVEKNQVTNLSTSDEIGFRQYDFDRETYDWHIVVSRETGDQDYMSSVSIFGGTLDECRLVLAQIMKAVDRGERVFWLEGNGTKRTNPQPDPHNYDELNF